LVGTDAREQLPHLSFSFYPDLNMDVISGAAAAI
jgi:hypothetical protein